MKMKLIVGASVLGAFLAMQTARAADCSQIMGNPESKEGVSVCNDGSVEVGGKIKDVSMHTPLGGENGFPQKAGRDIEGGVHAVGDGAEHVTHEAGKVLKRVFGW
jgi:hypothetical protein